MSSTRPNVILFFTDQQRWDTTGVGGNPLGLTPNLDRMARGGTHATVAITPNPLCAPARASMQTGQYPTAVGCYRNEIPLPADATTLAHHFGKAGYATGYLGKWHLASENPVPQEQRGGYASWLASNTVEFTSDAYRTILFDDDGEAVLLPGYRADALTDAAIRFVTDHHDEPFFLFLSYLEPHQQNEVDAYLAPEGYAEQYQGRWMPPDLSALGAQSKVHEQIGGYFGQVKRLDEGLGRLRESLRSLGLLDNTIIAMTSDHGCHFRTRNQEYKRSCHDSSLRVPLALSGPGFDGGRVIDGPVSTLDLPPTLLDAAGLDVPAQMQGQSLLSSEDRRKEAFFQVSETEVGRGIRTKRWKYYVVAPDADGCGDAAAERYVEQALYDLDHDPYELENLAGYRTYTDVAVWLRETLARRMVDAGESEPVIEPAPARGRGRLGEPRVNKLDVRLSRIGHQPKPTRPNYQKGPVL